MLVAVLGAGTGSRLGGDKLSKDLGGRPLGMWAISSAQALGAPVAFISSLDVPVWLERNAPECEIIVNPRAGSGMATSLVLATHIALQRRSTALLVMLADMPFVTTETLQALLALNGTDDVMGCRYADDGRLGPPVCFGAGRFDVLSNLTGDAGARHLLNQPGIARGITVSETELIDIDTQEDLDKARNLKLR